jgi:hypothetical protein
MLFCRVSWCLTFHQPIEITFMRDGVGARLINLKVKGAAVAQH